MFSGIVIKGDGLGKNFGYPTANLDIDKKTAGLKPGVYAAYAFLRKKKYPAALVLKDKPWKVEVHLLDYKGENFYGALLKVKPVQKVGEAVSFDMKEELTNKIGKDLKKIKKALKISNV